MRLNTFISRENNVIFEDYMLEKDYSFLKILKNVFSSSGDGLAFCPSGPTCCTKGVEQRLGAWSERQYRYDYFRGVALLKSLYKRNRIYVSLNNLQ